MQSKINQDFWDAGIEALSTFSKREGHSAVPAKHREGNVELGGWVCKKRRNYSAGFLSRAQVDQLERFPGWEWERVTVSAQKRHRVFWDARIRALTAFEAREGHSDVPYKHREGEIHLGRWVKHKRERYRKGKLSSEQIGQLEAIPGWEWERSTRPICESHRNKWDEGIAALTVFAAREAHCSVPRKHREDGVGLGYWVDSKRKNYRNGLLSQEQIAQLEALQSWDWGPYDDRWWPDFEVFKTHVLEGGSPEPERNTVVNGLELFAWCKQQHARHRKGSLSAGATSALEAIPGWVWRAGGTPHEDRRKIALSSYMTFVLREGHGRVPLNLHVRGFNLGRHLSNARQMLSDGRGSQEMQKLLDEISVDWRKSLKDEPVATPKQQKAQSRYRRFVLREGHGRVPIGHVEWGFELGKYLAGSRHRLTVQLSYIPYTRELLDAVSTDWRLPLRDPASTTSNSYSKAA